ncbi:flagellar hook-associated protein FlgK [Zavarzinia sp.]|uniref:flagellar hook-associated protein FlgK n=1 Tax=Zavarzinia sp. TaxID=2027920 RepID=UPI003568D9F8
MSLTGAMNAALAGLNVQQRAIQTVSGNVSNATNPDYTRKTAVAQATGAGVITADVTRATNDALARDLLAYASLSGQTDAQSAFMTKLSTLFGVSSGQTGLATAVEDFSDAWTVLQSTPDSAAAEADVLAKAGDLADMLNKLSSGLESIDKEVQSETASTVDDINGLLDKIDTLNKQIKTTASASVDTNDLEDQRDAAVRSLSALIDVKTIARSDGTLAVFTAGGQTLVDQHATKLAYDGTDVTRAGDGVAITGSIRSGKLAGLLSLRATGTSTDAGTATITELKAQVLAFKNALSDPSITGGFAATYDAAAAGTGELASGFFTMTGGTIAVNTALTDGTATLKQGAINSAGAALVDGSRSFSAGGLSVSGQDYAGIANAITASLAADVGTVTNKASLAAATKTEAETRFQSSVGINMDSELANLQVLQNAYAASAKVMQTVNSLYDDLFAVLR